MGCVCVRVLAHVCASVGGSVGVGARMYVCGRVCVGACICVWVGACVVHVYHMYLCVCLRVCV